MRSWSFGSFPGVTERLGSEQLPVVPAQSIRTSSWVELPPDASVTNAFDSCSGEACKKRPEEQEFREECFGM